MTLCRPFMGRLFLLDEFVTRFDDASHAWDEFLRDADEGGEVFVGHAVSDFCAAGDEGDGEVVGFVLRMASW